MGLLTSDSGASKANIGRGLQRLSTPLSALFYIGGIFYFAGNVWPAFNHDTYISENSLLPGVVTEGFHSDHWTKQKYDELKQLVKGSENRDIIPYQWLYKEFLDARLEAYIQNFTVQYPLGLGQEYSGRNVFGIVRAPRGASNEAIVVAVPYDRNMLPAVAVLLGLAKHCHGDVYWAKDLIFVVTEKREIGMQAWLNAYHGKSNNEYLTADDMSIHSGPIQAAICLELSDMRNLARSDISYNMINGQLPNLDLVNVAVRLAEKHHLSPTIYDMKESYISYTWDGYSQLLTTAFRGILRQATGPKSGLHQVFGQFGIEAVTTHPKTSKFGGMATAVQSVSKMMEGILRSVNNLLERFHQSFFFYLLLSPYRYMSIGVYMPAVAAMLLAPLLKACALWVQVTTSEEVEEENKGSNPSTQRKSEEGSKGRPGTGQTSADVATKPNKRDCSVWTVAPYFISAHGFGLIVRLIPDYAHILLQQLPFSSIQVEYVVLVAAVIALLSSVLFPAIMKKLYKVNNGKESHLADLFRCLCLLELGLVVGVISVLNFGLGFILCLTWVPVFSIMSPIKKRWETPLKLSLMILSNPLVLLFLGHFVWMAPSEWYDVDYLLQVATLTIDSIVSMIIGNYLHGSWMFTLVTAVLYPLWMLFWTLVHFRE